MPEQRSGRPEPPTRSGMDIRMATSVAAHPATPAAAAPMATRQPTIRTRVAVAAATVAQAASVATLVVEPATRWPRWRRRAGYREPSVPRWRRRRGQRQQRARLIGGRRGWRHRPRARRQPDRYGNHHRRRRGRQHQRPGRQWRRRRRRIRRRADVGDGCVERHQRPHDPGPRWRRRRRDPHRPARPRRRRRWWSGDHSFGDCCDIGDGRRQRHPRQDEQCVWRDRWRGRRHRLLLQSSATRPVPTPVRSASTSASPRRSARARSSPARR